MSSRADASPRPNHVSTRGVVYIHSAPASLCPHITWALESVLQPPVRLDWTSQPAEPRLLRAELSWTEEVGAGARLASALRGWDHVRYEVTEEASRGTDGSRWSHTPSLGIHHSWISAAGDALVHEEQIRAAMHRAAGDGRLLHDELDLVLGGPWDRELEPFRYAGDGAPVRWLHKVG